MLEKFTIFGIGGCGCNIAHRAAQQSTIQAVCIDTDTIALESKSPDCQTLLVGEDRFDGLGTGGDFASARMTANDIKPVFRQQLKDCSLAIVVTGIGGGTGSAITPALLETARNMSIPTIVFIVFPFSMEGSEKNKVANTAVRNICDQSDIYCVFKNDELCGSILSSSNISLYDAMEEASDHIVTGITMFWRMISQPGYINLDFANLLSSTKKGRGQFYICKGAAYGDGRTQIAINELLNSKSGVNTHANEISHALVGVFGGHDLRLTEIGDTVSSLSMQLPPDTSIELGTVIDPMANDSIEIVTMLFKSWYEQYSSIPMPILESQKQIKSIGTIATHTHTIASSQQPTQNKTSSALYDIFRGTQGLIYNGENLDEPTYLRKRIPIS